MGGLTWPAVLVSVVTAALDALANLLLATLTPHTVPIVVNLFALAAASVAALFAFAAHLAARVDRRLELIGELMTRRLEELENRIGDRNTGFVEGYMLNHAETSVPEASVVPLAPRGPRRGAQAEPGFGGAEHPQRLPRVHHGED